MNAPLDAALARYIDRLLAGTGLDPATAAAVAADPQQPTPPQAAAAAAALRDGWATAALALRVAASSPRPVIEPGQP